MPFELQGLFGTSLHTTRIVLSRIHWRNHPNPPMHSTHSPRTQPGLIPLTHQLHTQEKGAPAQQSAHAYAHPPNGICAMINIGHDISRSTGAGDMASATSSPVTPSLETLQNGETHSCLRMRSRAGLTATTRGPMSSSFSAPTLPRTTALLLFSASTGWNWRNWGSISMTTFYWAMGSFS